MWEQIFNLAVNNGIWAVLFLALLIYQIKDSKERENKYQKTIASLSGSVEHVKKISDSVNEVKNRVIALTSSTKNVEKSMTKIESEISNFFDQKIVSK